MFLVRAYLPDATAADVRAAAARAAGSAAQMHREGFRIRYLDTIYVPEDSWLGCLYEVDSAAEARLATERAVLPFDDIVEAVRYGEPTTQAAGA